jgi:hypothetical protein
VSVNLDSSLPQQKLYQNLHRLGVINAPEILEVTVVGKTEKLFFDKTFAERIWGLYNVPKLSFATVSESKIFALLCSSVLDEIPLSLPVFLPGADPYL